MKTRLALAALLLLGTATAADAKHYRISLDGYCDGWDFTTAKDTGYAVGVHLYDNCSQGEQNAAMSGVVGKYAGSKPALMGDDSYRVNYGYIGFSVVTKENTWQILGTLDGGKTQVLINSGTWSDGYAPGHRSSKRAAGNPK